MTRRNLIFGIASCSLALKFDAFANNSLGLVSVNVPDDFPTIDEAYNSLPASGGIIKINAGIYREKLLFEKPNVRLIGMGSSFNDVKIVWGDSAIIAGGTGKSATLTVTGNGFRATNLTIANEYHIQNPLKSQAVAFYNTADNSVLRNVCFLGAQDTLYAASKSRQNPSKQYYARCYIEGHVDFVFGNALAFFDNCNIRFITNISGFLTAHSRLSAEETSAYIFHKCLITSQSNEGDLYLGRAWRPYAKVVFIECQIDANIKPEGWREWNPGVTETYKTAEFMEYRTSGNAADTSSRVSWSKQLNAREARKYTLRSVFGDISWIRSE